MNSWQGTALFLFGLAAGYAIGSGAVRSAADSGQAAVLSRELDAVRDRAERAESELATSRETRRRIRESSSQPKGAIPADTREPFEPDAPSVKPAVDAAAAKAAIDKRLNEIRAALHGYFANHEGEKALAALRELASLGPDARDDMMKLALDINADVNGPGELGLAMPTFYTCLGDPAIRDVMTWALENPAASSADFRVMSAWSLPWTIAGADETIARFEAALATESDRGVQSALIGSVTMMKTPKGEALLARVFGDPDRDPGLRADAALAIATSKDPVVLRALETAAAADPEPRVQSAAKLALVVRNPPATGCLVLRTTPDGIAEASGVKAGDVIVSYNGRAVPTDGDLRNEIAAVSGTEPVPLVVVRDGAEQTIQVKPGRLGVTPRSVQKK